MMRPVFSTPRPRCRAPHCDGGVALRALHYKARCDALPRAKRCDGLLWGAAFWVHNHEIGVAVSKPPYALAPAACAPAALQRAALPRGCVATRCGPRHLCFVGVALCDSGAALPSRCVGRSCFLQRPQSVGCLSACAVIIVLRKFHVFLSALNTVAWGSPSFRCRPTTQVGLRVLGIGGFGDWES